MNTLRELMAALDANDRAADFAHDEAREAAIDGWSEAAAMRKYNGLVREGEAIAARIREIDPGFSFLRMQPSAPTVS